MRWGIGESPPPPRRSSTHYPKKKKTTTYLNKPPFLNPPNPHPRRGARQPQGISQGGAQKTQKTQKLETPKVLVFFRLGY